MNTGGINVRSYTIEDHRILFVCDERGWKDMFKVKKFVLEQHQVVEFEWNQQKYHPEPAGAKKEEAEEGDEPVHPLAKFGVTGV